MTLESDVAAIASRSLWLRARDLAGASGAVIYSWPDYDGVRATALSQTSTPTMTVSTDAPPLSSKSVRSNGAYGLVVGRLVQPVVSTFASSSLSTAYGPDNAFNASPANEWVSNLTTSGHIGAQFSSAFVATQYQVQGRTAGAANQAPRAWTFEGSNNGSSWTVLDTRSAQSPTSPTTYTFSNSTAFAYYRLNVSAVQSGGVAVGVKSLVVQDGGGGPLTTIHGGTASEVWAVLKSTTLSSSWYKAGVDVECFYPFSDGKVYDDFGATTRPSFTPAASVTSWHIVRFQMDAGTKSVWIDGVLQNSVSGLSVSWNSSIGIGKGTIANHANTANHYIAEIVAFNAKLSSGDATTVLDYLTAQHFTAASTTGTGDATAPAPTASGSGTVPTEGSGDAAAPAPTAAGSGVAGANAATGTATAPVPTAEGAGTVTITGSGDATAPTPYAEGSGTGAAPSLYPLLPATSVRGAGIRDMGSQAAPFDGPLLGARSGRGARLVAMLTPAGEPWFASSLRSIQRQAHLMPALSAEYPRGTFGSYTVDEDTVGELRLFVGGQDYTYVRGIPVDLERHTSEAPMGPMECSFKLPAMQPWDEPGVGDFSALVQDAAVEVVIVRPDDSVEYRWEGYLSSEDIDHSETDLSNGFRAVGTFHQAAAWPHDPPVYMERTDIGHLIADALNRVPHRRWSTIPKVTTGITTLNRGQQGQSAWQYVQDLLAIAWTEDGRQWTLRRVGRYNYRIALKASTTVADFTFTRGAPGVSVSLSRDYSTRRDAVFARGYAPDGGYWENRFFPGLDFGQPPRYPMNNPSLTLTGRSDATTDTGNGITLWQRRMRDLGYPVAIDGVMNSADAEWVRKVQKARGILVDGILGPQTWTATFETNSTEADLSSIRLPLVRLDDSSPWLYAANGARKGRNPDDNAAKVIHAMPEVDWGTDVRKSAMVGPSQRLLDRESVVGYTGTLTVRTDPHEAGTSRLDITEGANVEVLGHHGGVVVQVAAVDHQATASVLTVDTKARDAMSVDAVILRDRDARRDIAARGRTNDRSSLNDAQVVQYESESRAGFLPRVAVNGDVGLWSGRMLFVSQVGVAKVELETSPDAEIVACLASRPLRISTLASLVPDPLASDSGWYDHVEKLRGTYGVMEVFGTPSNPGGYYPRQKGNGALTGALVDTSSLIYGSDRGGFVWLYLFTSRSCWVEGRVFPAVPR